MPDFDRARGYGFQATQDDDQFLQHPLTGALIVSKGISLSVDTADIKVQFENDLIATIPAGVLAAGVRHDLKIKKLFDTGTGSVNVFIWLD